MALFRCLSSEADYVVLFIFAWLEIVTEVLVLALARRISAKTRPFNPLIEIEVISKQNVITKAKQNILSFNGVTSAEVVKLVFNSILFLIYMVFPKQCGTVK